MDAYAIAQRSLHELDERLKSPDHFNLLRCAAEVRQLLFDKHATLAQAQRVRGEPFKVQVGNTGIDLSAGAPAEELVFFMTGDFTAQPGKPSHALNLDQFGKMPVIYASGAIFTVRQVVLYLANARGGVHFDEKSLKDREELDHLSRSFQIFGNEAAFEQLRYIAAALVQSAKLSGWIP